MARSVFSCREVAISQFAGTAVRCYGVVVLVLVPLMKQRGANLEETEGGEAERDRERGGYYFERQNEREKEGREP